MFIKQTIWDRKLDRGTRKGIINQHRSKTTLNIIIVYKTDTYEGGQYNI